MGEYALNHNQRIKIGTCEDMYYLRWEDRFKVQPVSGNVDPSTDIGLRFRLPFPDEDLVGPGGYEVYNRGLRLGHTDPNYHGIGKPGWVDWAGEAEMMATVGHIQLRHEPSGLLLNVPCHHGFKLPECGPGMNAHWNGKSHSMELTSVKAMDDGRVVPVVSCRHCGEAWRDEWDNILPEVPEPMRSRLVVHAGAKV